MENPNIIRAASPSPSLSLDANVNANDTNSSTLRPAPHVLGFLRKRSNLSAATASKDRAKSMVVTSTADFESALPSPTPTTCSSGGNAIKNLIRRKSAELSRLVDGNSSTTFKGSNSDSGSRASMDQEVFQEKRSPVAMHDRGVNSVDFTRSASPVLAPASKTTAIAAPEAVCPGGRRATFSLGLPWRPQSEYSNNNGPSGLQSGLTRSQRRFVRAFPELADLVMVPSAYCASCMATPPQTPPASISRSSSTTSPSNTINSSDLSSTPSSNSLSLSCPGHFDDFSCALEREILWQGTVYVTATHVCFYGKHFGKTVRVMIDYRDMVSIEKEKKMGVFPSSIRIRTRTPIMSNGKEQEGPVRADTASTEEDVSIKDYVFTSLISREQAFAIMDRSWTVHRRVMRTLVSTGLESPQDEIAETESYAADIFNMDLKARIRSGTLREQRRGPRTYSVITDESFSSNENLDRSNLNGCLPSKRLPPVTYIATSNNIDAVESSNVNTDDYVQRKDGMSSLSSDSRRGSTASASSLSDKQELPSTGLMGFLQRRASQRRRGGKSSATADGSSSLEQQEVITQNPPDCAYSPALPTRSTPTMTIGASVVIQPSLPNSLREGASDISRSSTPPVLISPSLTTTKVSHSSSTVQTVAQPGNSRGVTVHIRKESGDTMVEKTPKDNVASTATATDPVPTLVAAAALESLAANVTVPVPVIHPPSSPVSCGCQRHYKNAVVSTIIPLPLDLCFEILFSAKGAGLGDKLGCDTHRIKDGSTEIKIMPWQGEEPKTMTAWEARKRNLEYTVAFKMPMMAKSSTACFETQEVNQYSDFIILVHSESRTPSVPYGEHFSTVNQICMTWEAPNKTRIKCYTEVKFKKSIMWSGKVEAGSLEGSGGFYKEFIRQLQELAETQGEQLIKAAAASKQSRAPVETGSVAIAPAPSVVANGTLSVESTDAAPAPVVAMMAMRETGAESTLLTPPPSYVSSSAMATAAANSSSSSEPTEMSRAQSLLSQQYLRNIPQGATAANSSSNAPATIRLSLDTARLQSEPSTTLNSSIKDQSAPLPPSERRSAISMFLESWVLPSFPIVSTATATLMLDSSNSKDSSLESPVKDSDTTSAAATSPGLATSTSSPGTPLWGDFARRGWTLFGRANEAQLQQQQQPGDSSSLSSLGSSQESGEPFTTRSGTGSVALTEKNDVARVKFALPESGRPFSRAQNASERGGGVGRSILSVGSSIRSSASVPSLASSFKEHGRRRHDLANKSDHESQEQNQRLSLQPAKEQPKLEQQQQKHDRQYRFLSRAVFGFMVLGLLVTALNVWHLFSIMSTVVKVVQQRHDILFSRHQHQQRPGLQQQQQQRLEHQRQYQHIRQHSYYNPQHHGWHYQPDAHQYRHYQGQYYYRHDPYHHPQQQQAWMSDEDYAAWNKRSSRPSGAAPAPEHTQHDEKVELEEKRELAPLQTQKEVLKAEIVELFALLEHARKELAQVSK